MNEAKNILIITTDSGFSLQFEKNNIKTLKRLGFNVHVAANPEEHIYEYNEGAFQKAGVQFHPISIAKSPYKIVNNYTALKEIRDLIICYHIDIIHCHNPMGGALGRLVARLESSNRYIHTIYTAHGFHYYKGAPLVNRTIYKSVEAYLSRWTDDLITINREDFEAAQRLKLKKGGRIHYIPGVGLDLDEFCPYSTKDRARSRRRLGIGGSETILLSVGELNENKNHKVVIDALYSMKTEGTDISRFRYFIVGKGRLHHHIQEIIHKYSLDGIVSLSGYIPPLRDGDISKLCLQDFIGAADLFCFPSIREGLGMAALESMAMGIPVLASDNRGSREYVSENENGWICKYNDTASWIYGINRFTNLTEGELMNIKNNCLETAARFSKTQTDKIMIEIYKKAYENVEQRKTSNNN